MSDSTAMNMIRGSGSLMHERDCKVPKYAINRLVQCGWLGRNRFGEIYITLIGARAMRFE